MDTIDLTMEFIRQLKERYIVVKVATLEGGASRSGKDMVQPSFFRDLI